MELIVFAIVGVVEIGPNRCKIDYMRYVDVESVVIPCTEYNKRKINSDKQ
jgi:hypothetical protein